MSVCFVALPPPFPFLLLPSFSFFFFSLLSAVSSYWRKHACNEQTLIHKEIDTSQSIRALPNRVFLFSSSSSPPISLSFLPSFPPFCVLFYDLLVSKTVNDSPSVMRWTISLSSSVGESKTDGFPSFFPPFISLSPSFSFSSPLSSPPSLTPFLLLARAMSSRPSTRHQRYK